MVVKALALTMIGFLGTMFFLNGRMGGMMDHRGIFLEVTCSKRTTFVLFLGLTEAPFGTYFDDFFQGFG